MITWVGATHSKRGHGEPCIVLKPTIYIDHITAYTLLQSFLEYPSCVQNSQDLSYCVWRRCKESKSGHIT